MSDPGDQKVKVRRFWRRWSFSVAEYDPSYKTIYLGNVLTVWSKGQGCVDNPLSVLWDSYCNGGNENGHQHDMNMKLTVCNSGLKAVTKEHGLTEYWAYRITYCGTHPQHPRIFCWIYRHDGGSLKHELRCHAVLCSKEEKAQLLSSQLNEKLVLALQEFKREKMSRQKNRLSLANPTFPRRKLLLSTGAANFRPRADSAPTMTRIEELGEEEDESYSSDSKAVRFQTSRSMEEENKNNDSCRM